MESSYIVPSEMGLAGIQQRIEKLAAVFMEGAGQSQRCYKSSGL